MKRFLFIGLLLMTTSVFGQKGEDGFKTLTDAQAKERINSIPTENGKILYDQIIDVPGENTNELFIKIRNWFVEKFTDSKSVLEVNDIDNGLLTGKGTYRFDKTNGLNKHIGFVTFILNVKVKDGKFRYQLYSFNYEGIKTGVLGSSSTGIHENVDINDIFSDYKKGGRIKRDRQYLTDIVNLQDYFDKSLRYNVAIKKDISDF